MKIGDAFRIGGCSELPRFTLVICGVPAKTNGQSGDVMKQVMKRMVGVPSQF